MAKANQKARSNNFLIGVHVMPINKKKVKRIEQRVKKRERAEKKLLNISKHCKQQMKKIGVNISALRIKKQIDKGFEIAEKLNNE